MLRNIQLFLIIGMLATSCLQNPENIPEPRDSPYVLEPGRYISSKGKVISMDSVSRPIYVLAKGKYVDAGQPTYLPELSNHHPVGQPKYYPAKGDRINMDLVAKPKKIFIQGKIVSSPWPKWIPTQLAYSENTRFHFSYLTVEQGLKSNVVRCFLQDHEGRIWIAGYNGGGLSVWDGTGFMQYSRAEGLSINGINCLLLDQVGNIWVGTDNGVNIWNGNGFTHYTSEEGLHGERILSLLEDNTGKIWVGTNDGLNVWDGTGFTRFTTVEGLSNNVITSALNYKSLMI